MIKSSIIFLFLVPTFLFGKAVREQEIGHQKITSERDYSSEKIFKMIQNAKKNESLCNIEVESDGYSFSVKKGGHSFSFVNYILDGKKRHRSTYDCLLTQGKRKLECNRRLSRDQTYQISDMYISLTINLDEAGNAVSMHGEKSRKYILAGHTIDILSDLVTEFKCDIEHPAVITDPTVRNGIDRSESSSNTTASKELEKSGATQK